MNASAEASLSLWMATADVRSAPPLERDEETEIVVVGAGIAGLAVAYELGKLGRSVLVLDRGPLAGGMSARTSAHLACDLDDWYHALIGLRGMEDTRICYESQAAAIDRIEQIAASEGIACDFRRLDGYLFTAPGSDPQLLDREIDACHAIGYRTVAWAERAPLAASDTGRCLRFPGQARFHPRKYLDGLIGSIRSDGGRLFADTPVVGVDEDQGAVTVRTAAGPVVRAQAAVVATNAPINDWMALHTKQAPYRTYVIAGPIPKGSVADALYWDTAKPYHYVRIQPLDEHHDLLIAGGEDHRSGTAHDMAERFARLHAWTQEHVAALERIDYRWSGQWLDPVDHLAFIGRNHGNDHVFVASGDSGQGLTNGTIAGLLLPDLILGRENAWSRTYDPKRVTFAAAARFAQENASVAANLAEYATGGEIGSAEELAPGQGAIMRQGLKKVAAYRDEGGTLHLRSATCTHAGCIVHWNPLERCWDCPCHGSHFAPTGEPINGPAVHSLHSVTASG